jgi:hypothetical protein
VVTPPARAPSRIHFEIRSITLQGFSPGQQRRFISTLRSSLAELGARGGSDWMASGGATMRHLDAGAVGPGAGPEETAKRVASRIGNALAGERGRGGPR